MYLIRVCNLQFAIHAYNSLAAFYYHVISETASEEDRALFLREIEIMKQIGCHRNVLSMVGFWVKSEPIMLILEYVPHGDLLNWLRSKRQQVKNPSKKLVNAAGKNKPI